MELAEEILGYPLHKLMSAFWAAKFTNGEWMCNANTVRDIEGDGYRFVQWKQDIVDTGEQKNITELWLFCPPHPSHPDGCTAHLSMTRPGTAFQFYITEQANKRGKRPIQASVIGRVDDADGKCTCYAWDKALGLLTPEYTMTDPDGSRCQPLKTNVRSFGWRVKDGKKVSGMWRPELTPPDTADIL